MIARCAPLHSTITWLSGEQQHAGELILVALGFSCASFDIVPTIVGVNSLLMTLDANPIPDMVAVGLTPTNDGFSHTGGASGTGAFAIASVHTGATGQLTARARPPQLEKNQS
jgi:hypothetical protein